MSVKDIEERTAHRDTAPDPDWVRARCPLCDGPVVSNYYYLGGHNGCGAYIGFVECWFSLGPVEERTCSYRSVL